MQRRRIKQLEVAATEFAEQVEETISLINEELKDCCAVCVFGKPFGNDLNVICNRFPQTVTKIKSETCGEFKDA